MDSVHREFLLLCGEMKPRRIYQAAQAELNSHQASSAKWTTWIRKEVLLLRSLTIDAAGHQSGSSTRARHGEVDSGGTLLK